MNYKKPIPLKLSDAGKDEIWLRDQIVGNTSILELGNLVVIQEEIVQQMEGRIGLLMYDIKESIEYKVEIIRGILDESYITNTIEYWDLEKEKYLALEKRIVIVAEDITSRLYNIMRLIYRPVHIIFIQASVLKDDNQLRPRFARVLDMPKSINKMSQKLQESTGLVNRGLHEKLTFTDSIVSPSASAKITPRPLIFLKKGVIGWGI